MPDGQLGQIGTDLVTPDAGDYKLTFSYRNGVGQQPTENLKVNLLQSGSAVASVSIGNAAQPNWTLAESGVISLTNSPVTVEITGNTPATRDVTAHFDRFMLVPVTGGVPLDFTYKPDDRVYLSRTRTITVNPTGGTGPYTVTFDIGNTGTADHTVSATPYSYTWDTLASVPQDTSRTLNVDTGNTPFPVKITVTDSASGTDEVVANYTVDNELDGRVSLVSNGDFSQWQAPDDAGNRLPVGWVEHPSAAVTIPTYGPGPSYAPEAGDALTITFSVSPSDTLDRYSVISQGVAGNYHDLQTTFWGRGAYCRLYYMISTDNGATYATSLQDAGQANASTWTYAVESPVQPNTLGLSNPDYRVALGTHIVGLTEHAWDDVTWEGKLIPTDSDVEGWNLY